MPGRLSGMAEFGEAFSVFKHMLAKQAKALAVQTDTDVVYSLTGHVG